jgi:hypothetical protein
VDGALLNNGNVSGTIADLGNASSTILLGTATSALSGARLGRVFACGTSNPAACN